MRNHLLRTGERLLAVCGRQDGNCDEPAQDFLKRADLCRMCERIARQYVDAERKIVAPQRPARPVRCRTSGCDSYAINPGHLGREEGVDLHLCDVCYWKARARKPASRPIAEAPQGPHVRLLVFYRRWRIGYRGLNGGWREQGTGAHIHPTKFQPLPADEE